MECTSPGLLPKTYFCGKDEFKIVSRSAANLVPVSLPASSCTFVDILCKTSIELIMYRKSYKSCAWFAKGFGIGCTTEECTYTPDYIYPEVEIFPNELQITKVTESPEGMIGLSELTNSFYHCLLNFDVESDQFKPRLEEIKVKQQRTVDEAAEDEILTPEAEGCIPKFTHLASVDTDVYAVDETNSIYNVLKDKLIWTLPRGKITKLVCGFSHNLLLTDTGAVYGWGNGSRGQLGQDVIILSCPTPQRIEFFDDLPCIVSDIVAGGWHTLALTSDGDVYAWGWNESNQLGLPSHVVPSVQGTPYPIDLGSCSNPIIAIGAGSRHSLVQMKDGSVYAWGFNKFGQLGLGDTTNRELPVKVNLSNLNEDNEEQYVSGRGTSKLMCGRWCTFITY